MLLCVCICYIYTVVEKVQYCMEILFSDLYSCSQYCLVTLSVQLSIAICELIF